MENAENESERMERFLNRTSTVWQAIAEAVALTAMAATWVAICCL